MENGKRVPAVSLSVRGRIRLAEAPVACGSSRIDQRIIPLSSGRARAFPVPAILNGMNTR